MNDKFKYQITKEIVCPYCFKTLSNSENRITTEDDDFIVCEKCGKKFLCCQHRDITYVSRKKLNGDKKNEL